MNRFFVLFLVFSFSSILNVYGSTLPIPEFKDKPVKPKHKEKVIKASQMSAIVAPKAERKVLVVSATNGFRHKSIPTGKFALSQLAESTKAFEVIFSNDPGNFEIESLNKFDAICLLNVSQDFFAGHRPVFNKLSEEEKNKRLKEHHRLMDNLVAYVENGGGLIGIHAATDSCYNHSCYQETIGGVFDGHPWSKNHRVHIVVEDMEHELCKPVFDKDHFELIEEIYQFKQEPYSREKVRVLLSLDPELSDKPSPRVKIRRDDKDFPVAWIREPKNGRVFYSSLGHNDHIYWNPLVLKHFLAGIQYVCGDLEADATPSNEVPK